MLTALAFVALARTSLLFHARGPGAVARATRTAMRGTPTDAAALLDSGVDVFRAQRALRRAKRCWPGQVLCLQTALSLEVMLRWLGVTAVLCLGVRRHEGEVQAHAWLEVGGLVLDDSKVHHAFAALDPCSHPVRQRIEASAPLSQPTLPSAPGAPR